MDYKKIAFSIFLIFICTSFFGQNNITISGRVTDAKTKENLVFVNIGIEGTLIGTASNSEGEFSLNIPEKYSTKNLYFSTIGYDNYIIPVNKLSTQKINFIELQPLTYGIDDIEITTQSKVLYRIIRNAAEKIPENFIHQAFSTKALYQQEEFINNTLDKKRDAIVLISDKTGYVDKKDAFIARNYQFLKMHRNFEVKSLESGMTLMDDLLSFDIARSPENILDLDYLNEYDMELIDNSVIGTDSVWIIAYQLSNPTQSRTGDIYANSYEGKLYISKTDNILLKAETHIRSDKNSKHSRVIATNNTELNGQVDYNFITSYKKSNSGLLLDKIVLNKNFQDKQKRNVKITASLLTIEVNTKQPKMLTGRQYFEKLNSDPNFWTDLKQNQNNN